MGSRPALHLHIDGDSLLHRLPARAKLVGLLAFALVVVSVPRPGWIPLTLAMLVGLGLVVGTGVAFRHVWPRLLVEVPFVVFAIILPFVATGPRVSVGPLHLSQAGLVGGWLLVAKGTAAVLAATAFSVTTSARDLVVALQQLRVPDTLVAIFGFMVRYATVVIDELARMRIARESRGFHARSLRAWPVIGRTLAVLFVRSYERGERVHVAMTSRGWTGRYPLLTTPRPSALDWATVSVPAVVVAVAALGWGLLR